MITSLGDWFSKLVKRSRTSKEPEELNPFEDMKIAAYFNIAVNDEGELLISSDFIDGEEEAIAKLVFLLCSGSLMEIVGNIVTQRCEDNTEQRDQILSTAYNMILNNISEMVGDDTDIEEDEDAPLVDPCFVFRPKMEDDEDDTD